jgi:hypothetical protein
MRPASPVQEGSCAMRRGLLVGLGALVTVAGVVFALQGLGYIGGSSMTGTTLWSVLGPLIAVLGLAMIVAGLRARRRRA